MTRDELRKYIADAGRSATPICEAVREVLVALQAAEAELRVKRWLDADGHVFKRLEPFEEHPTLKAAYDAGGPMRDELQAFLNKVERFGLYTVKLREAFTRPEPCVQCGRLNLRKVPA